MPTTPRGQSNIVKKGKTIQGLTPRDKNVLLSLQDFAMELRDWQCESDGSNEKDFDFDNSFHQWTRSLIGRLMKIPRGSVDSPQPQVRDLAFLLFIQGSLNESEMFAADSMEIRMVSGHLEIGRRLKSKVA